MKKSIQDDGYNCLWPPLEPKRTGHDVSARPLYWLYTQSLRRQVSTDLFQKLKVFMLKMRLNSHGAKDALVFTDQRTTHDSWQQTKNAGGIQRRVIRARGNSMASCAKIGSIFLLRATEPA